MCVYLKNNYCIKVKGLSFIPLVFGAEANEQMEADKRHHYIVKICAEKGDHFYGGFRLMKGKCAYGIHIEYIFSNRKPNM